VQGPVRPRGGTLRVLLALVALAAPIAVLIHAADPSDQASTGPGIRLRPVTQRLSWTCARTAHNGEQLAQQFGAAAAGQTVCLASGDYGTFIAGRKPGPVGIRPKRGANVSMALELNSTLNVHVDGVTVRSAEIGGESRNISISNSRFTGLTIVHADQLVNANILFDHNVHANIDTCTSCFQGRLHVDGNTGRPAGVVIRDSVFSGGNSDGVRADADGIKVLDNRFFGFRDQDPFHTDPIQIYGGSHVLIRGNYFHDNSVSAQIMMADGGAHNVVADNVVSGGGYTWAITWFSDVDSVIAHNTFAGGVCKDGVPCGMLNLGAKAQDPPGHGTIIRDNVMAGISNHGEAKVSAYTASHNLTPQPIAGDGNITGVPQFRGPEGTYAGYRLAAGSPGSRGASDGKAVGIR
jgi:parallel beta helix pectate lyase-like protein